MRESVLPTKFDYWIDYCNTWRGIYRVGEDTPLYKEEAVAQLRELINQQGECILAQAMELRQLRKLLNDIVNAESEESLQKAREWLVSIEGV